MLWDTSNARYFKVWDDARSAILYRVVWIDDVLGVYGTVDKPVRHANGEVVVTKHYAKCVVYPKAELVVVNPTTVKNEQLAWELSQLLKLSQKPSVSP